LQQEHFDLENVCFQFPVPHFKAWHAKHHEVMTKTTRCACNSQHFANLQVLLKDYLKNNILGMSLEGEVRVLDKDLQIYQATFTTTGMAER
jgi:hypothetical protein